RWSGSGESHFTDPTAAERDVVACGLQNGPGAGPHLLRPAGPPAFMWPPQRRRKPERTAMMRIVDRAIAPTLGLFALLCALPAAAESPPLKIGLLEDHSGDIAIFTMPKVHGAHLAVDEINAAGGILGRKLEVYEYDPQFDNAKFQEFARRLIEKDK